MDPNLPAAEFAFPGPLRDALVAAILDGTKTSTTSLVAQYDDSGSDPLPRTGDRSILVDSSQRPLAVLEVTEVRLGPLSAVDLQHVLDEGEGHRTFEQWRTAHEDFWHSPELRGALGDPSFTVADDTPVVMERFRLVELL